MRASDRDPVRTPGRPGGRRRQCRRRRCRLRWTDSLTTMSELPSIARMLRSWPAIASVAPLPSKTRLLRPDRESAAQAVPPPESKSILEPSGTSAMKVSSASVTSSVPEASIDDGTMTALTDRAGCGVTGDDSCGRPGRSVPGTCGPAAQPAATSRAAVMATTMLARRRRGLDVKLSDTGPLRVPLRSQPGLVSVPVR